MLVYIKMVRELGCCEGLTPSLNAYSTYALARAACQVEIEEEEPDDVTLLRDDPTHSQSDHILWQVELVDSADTDHVTEITLLVTELDNGRY